MCINCRRAQQRIMAALLASDITLPTEPALRARAEAMLPEMEPDAARQVRACLALVFAANPPTEERPDAVVRDLDIPMLEKAMAVFPPRTMSQAGRMARNLSQEFEAVADCIEHVIFGRPGDIRVEESDGDVTIHLNEPEPMVADAPKVVVPHNGGRGPKPPVS